MEEDRSALFNQLKNFSQRKLKKVETKVVTASGEQLVEKRGAKGLQVLSGNEKGGQDQNAEVARKLDLQVGLILPGFLLASDDVAHDKSSLETYGITHILSLDNNVENKFDEDYNYKNVTIHDKPEFELERVLDDCFDFIDDGRHYGNVLVHCSGTIGLSRSTAVCIAYMMNKEKQSFTDAFNNVKEARSFVKPNEGFVKQLKEYEVKLRGSQKAKESGIDDPFALRKKQEIEQEKAMVAGAASVKNRMKMFGATLDTNANSSASARSKSVSPSPFKSPSTPQPQSPTPSKWSDKHNSTKSMTPEPRRSAPSAPIGGPPPPPPPMPTNLHEDKSIKPLNSSSLKSSSSHPPPPPPPPPAGDLSQVSSKNKQSTTSKFDNNESHLDRRDSYDNKRMVFGRVPPPAMKIKGGLSIEKHDPAADKNLGYNKSSKNTSSLQLPLKRQATTDSSGGENERAEPNPRAPSPSAALRAAKQQASTIHNQAEQTNKGSSDQRRPSASGQLNRSSTKKILNLIKTKTKTDLTLSDGDENDEIIALLEALENEKIENIDWDELGIDSDEINNILAGQTSSSESSDDEDEEESAEEEVEEEEVETSTKHYIIRS